MISRLIKKFADRMYNPLVCNWSVSDKTDKKERPLISGQRAFSSVTAFHLPNISQSFQHSSSTSDLSVHRLLPLLTQFVRKPTKCNIPSLVALDAVLA